MSKKMMIFYSFPFNFLWKSLMTLMTVTLMTGFMNICTHIHQGEFARDE